MSVSMTCFALPDDQPPRRSISCDLIPPFLRSKLGSPHDSKSLLLETMKQMPKGMLIARIFHALSI